MRNCIRCQAEMIENCDIKVQECEADKLEFIGGLNT